MPGCASEGNRVGAVGVLGTDPYDKLLVMQALHPALPEAIFFTTDLDAVYLHPTEVKRGTKNLVVASAFGLALDETWQGSILPFRDSYQTGTFLSTQLALGARRADDHGACTRSCGATHLRGGQQLHGRLESRFPRTARVDRARRFIRRANFPNSGRAA